MSRHLRLLLLLGVAAIIVAGCSSTSSPDILVKVGDGQLPAATASSPFRSSCCWRSRSSRWCRDPDDATSFTRIIVVLSLLRSAIGNPQPAAQPGHPRLSLFLTMFVMTPSCTQANNDASSLPERHDHAGPSDQQGITPFREFMLRQTRSEDLQVFHRSVQGSAAQDGRRRPRSKCCCRRSWSASSRPRSRWASCSTSLPDSSTWSWLRP